MVFFKDLNTLVRLLQLYLFMNSFWCEGWSSFAFKGVGFFTDLWVISSAEEISMKPLTVQGIL